MKSVTITMYRWAGRKFGITIKSACKECEINSSILEDMEKKEFAGKALTVEVKPWFTHLWESLRHGGWHAPVILVNDKLFSQGIVIDRKKLQEYVERELAKP